MGDFMTKQEVVATMSSELGITKKQCGKTLNQMLECIIEALETGKKFMQPGFGTFKTVDTLERVGINPSTGQKMIYPKKRRLKFKSSEKFKDEVNE